MNFLKQFFYGQIRVSSSTYSLGWMNLGISYVANGLYEEALAAYLKADELKPNNGKIIFNLGNLVKQFLQFVLEISSFIDKANKTKNYFLIRLVLTPGKPFDGRANVSQRCQSGSPVLPCPYQFDCLFK